MPDELRALVFVAKLFVVGSIGAALLVLTWAVINRKSTPATRAVRFWSWFLENEERLRDYERLPELYPEIESLLRVVDPSLSFEFGAADEQRYELVLSGPAAPAVVSRAPSLEWWVFSAR